MSKITAATCLLVASLAASVSAFEIGDTVVIRQDCALKEDGVVVLRAHTGEQFEVQGVDGRHLLLAGAASLWTDDAHILSLEAAVEHFSLLIEKNPADWQARCARGRAREALGDSYKGMLDLDEAVHIHPSIH